MLGNRMQSLSRCHSTMSSWSCSTTGEMPFLRAKPNVRYAEHTVLWHRYLSQIVSIEKLTKTIFLSKDGTETCQFCLPSWTRAALAPTLDCGGCAMPPTPENSACATSPEARTKRTRRSCSSCRWQPCSIPSTRRLPLLVHASPNHTCASSTAATWRPPHPTCPVADVVRHPPPQLRLYVPIGCQGQPAQEGDNPRTMLITQHATYRWNWSTHSLQMLRGKSCTKTMQKLCNIFSKSSASTTSARSSKPSLSDHVQGSARACRSHSRVATRSTSSSRAMSTKRHQSPVASKRNIRCRV